VEPGASPEDIRKAYLELAKRYHPDVAPSAIADKLMGRINAAYEVLKDPARRARYDRQLHDAQGAEPGATSAPNESRAPDPPQRHREWSRVRRRPGLVWRLASFPLACAVVVAVLVAVRSETSGSAGSAILRRAKPPAAPTAERAQAPLSGSGQHAPPMKPTLALGAKPLDPNALSRVVQKHQAEFQRCYESSVVTSLGKPGAEADALARVALTATVALASSGHVETVSLQGEARPMLESCLRGAIAALQFPQSDSGTEISFPLVFEPKVVPAKPRTPIASRRYSADSGLIDPWR